MKTLLLASILLIGTACSTYKAQRVSNKESDEKGLEITDKWMAEDNRRAVKAVIKQMKKHGGYKRLMKGFNGTPKIFIAEVQNNTSEAYFPIDDLNDEVLYELSAMGDFILIDNKAREQILKEITYQNDGMVDPTQAKQIGKQYGADFLIFGNVHMRPQSRDGKTIKEYIVNLRMTNLETASEVFRLRTRINKFSDKKAFGW